MTDDLRKMTTERCQAISACSPRHRCALPRGHRCAHDFISEPLTLLQSQAWHEEVARVRSEALEEAAKELDGANVFVSGFRNRWCKEDAQRRIRALDPKGAAGR